MSSNLFTFDTFPVLKYKENIMITEGEYVMYDE